MLVAAMVTIGKVEETQQIVQSKGVQCGRTARPCFEQTYSEITQYHNLSELRRFFYRWRRH